MLRRYAVTAQIVDAHGLECAITDMQRNLNGARAARRQLSHHTRRKMQPGGGRSNRATLACINSLVAFTVFRKSLALALDVWWQRRLADLFQQRGQRFITIEAYHATAIA